MLLRVVQLIVVVVDLDRQHRPVADALVGQRRRGLVLRRWLRRADRLELVAPPIGRDRAVFGQRRRLFKGGLHRLRR